MLPLHPLDVPLREARTKRIKQDKANYDYECATTDDDNSRLHSDDDVCPISPTAFDYASLFFCESSEEKDPRTKQVGERAAGGASRPAAAPVGEKKRRRRVSFGALIPTFHLIDDVPAASDMTYDERSALFLGRANLDLLKSSARLSVREMRGRLVAKDGPGYGNRSQFRSAMLALERESNASVRGLEHRVLGGSRARRSLVLAVLECQAHARGLARFGHVIDEDNEWALLAKVSRERSLEARSLALFDAMEDHNEVHCEVVDGRDRKLY